MTVIEDRIIWLFDSAGSLIEIRNLKWSTAGVGKKILKVVSHEIRKFLNLMHNIRNYQSLVENLIFCSNWWKNSGDRVTFCNQEIKFFVGLILSRKLFKIKKFIFESRMHPSINCHCNHFVQKELKNQYIFWSSVFSRCLST